MRKLITALLLFCFVDSFAYSIIFDVKGTHIYNLGGSVVIPINQHLTSVTISDSVYVTDDVNTTVALFYKQSYFANNQQLYDYLQSYVDYWRADKEFYGALTLDSFLTIKKGAATGYFWQSQDNNGKGAWVAAGVTGATGSVGATGNTGATGATGAVGATGATGATGTTVPNALSFSYGITGATSYDGSSAQTIKADTSTSGINLATQGYADRGRALVLLSTTTVSSAATVDITGLDATYSKYVIEYYGLVPATNNVEFWLRMSTDNGATYISTNTYNHGRLNLTNVSTTGAATVTGDSKIILVGAVVSNSAGCFVNGTIEIANPSQSTVDHGIRHRADQFGTSAANYFLVNSMGMNTTTTAVNAVRLLTSSGNITSAIVKVYGQK